MNRRIFLLFIIIIFELSSFARAPKVEGNRMPSKPFISGDGFRSMADHVYDETDKSLRADEICYADIIFVNTHFLEEFFAKLHQDINYPYILLSHNSDDSAPGKFASIW